MSDETIDRICSITIFASILICVAILAQQNFLFSDHFDLLSLREVDDFAFQASLRALHRALTSGHLGIFVSNNDYGYGSVFWMANAFITLPGYLLGNDRLTIVLPRMFCLLSGCGALFVLWKTGGLFTQSRSIRLMLPALMALQPEFAFACLRFHTHAHVLFCCALAFYLALRVRKKEQFIWSIVFLSLAVGIKLNALILAPVLAGIYAVRWDLSGWKSLIADYFRFGVIGMAFSVFFYNPLLSWFIFFPHESFMALRTLATYAVQGGGAGNQSWRGMIMDGLVRNYYGLWTLPFVIGTFALSAWIPKEKIVHYPIAKKIFLISIGGALLAALVLMLRLKQEPFAYANYLIAVAFIPLLCAFWLAWLPRKFQGLTALALLFAIGWSRHDVLDEFYFRYQYVLESQTAHEKLDDYAKLASILTPISGQTRILTDYRIVMPVSNFDAGVTRVDFFDNIFQSNIDYDYIIVSHESPLLWPEKKIVAANTRPDLQLKSHRAVKDLMTEGVFQKQYFDKIFENQRLIVFREGKKLPDEEQKSQGEL